MPFASVLPAAGPREEEMSGLGEAERSHQTKRTFSTGANKASIPTFVSQRAIRLWLVPRTVCVDSGNLGMITREL